MNLRTLNHKKNEWLRRQKEILFQHLLARKNTTVFDKQQVPAFRRIILLRNDNKLGDMITCTTLIKALKQQIPNAQLEVIAGKDSALILQNNPYVDKVHICKKTMAASWKLGRILKQEPTDLYIDLDRRTSVYSSIFIYCLRPRITFGFNRQGNKAYNLTTPLDFDKHTVSQWHQKLLELLGLTLPQTRYDLFVAPENEQRAQQFINTLPEKPFVLLNLFTASSSRSFSWEQACALADLLPHNTVLLIGQADQLASFKSCKPRPQNLFFVPENFQLFDLFALLAKSAALVTPDTMYVHAANALNKPLVVLYNDTPEAYSWAPKNIPCKVFLTKQPFGQFDVSLLAQAVQELTNRK